VRLEGRDHPLLGQLAVGVEAQRLAEVPLGTAVVARVELVPAEVAVRQGVVRVAGERALDGAGGLVALAELGKGHGAHVDGVDPFRVERQRALGVLDRAAPVALGKPGPGEQHERVRVLGVEADGLACCPLGGRGLVVGEQCRAHHVVTERPGRCEPDGLAGLGQGLCHPVQPDQAEAEQPVGAGVERGGRQRRTQLPLGQVEAGLPQQELDAPQRRAPAVVAHRRSR
jgi:hypothetical protein